MYAVRGWANSPQPFGHHSSTGSHRWQGQKGTGGQSYRNKSLSSYNKAFNRLGELQRSKSSDMSKEHLCCIKGCNNFLSTISIRVNEDILFLRWLNAWDILYETLLYIPPHMSLQGLDVGCYWYHWDSSFTVNSQRSNTKAVEFPKLCVVLMHCGVYLKVTWFLHISWHNKFYLQLFVLCFVIIHISFMLLCFTVNGKEKE